MLMVRSLFFKLLGAFALVIFVLVVVVAALANQATAGEFRAYTDRSGQVWAQHLAATLGDYYSQANTSEGVSGAQQDPVAQAGSVAVTPTLPWEAPQGMLLPTVAPLVAPTVLPPLPGFATLDPYAVQLTLQPVPNVISPESMSPTPDPSASGTGMGHGGMGMGMGMGMGRRGSPTTQPVMGPGMLRTPAPELVQPLNPADSENNPAIPVGHAGMGMGRGMQGRQGTDPSFNGELWTMMGQRVIVADASGRVISDSSGKTAGEVLPTEQLANGQMIQVAGQPAGTVLVEADESLPGSAAGEFLRSMNRSIWVAVAAASVVAMLLGGILFFQITAPVRKLKAAACAIAAGDLSQRVDVHTHDELGDLAAAFNYMADSLSQMEAQRRQLVADVAHEIRTPLSVMQANLEAMQDGVLPLDAEQIDSLHEETVLLSRLVADLRLLSLAEAGQLKLERVEMEPGELIRKSTERLNPNAQERGVVINVEIPKACPTVWADADRISQVIGNLISNALRYTNAGGAVTVKVDVAADYHTHPTPQPSPEVFVSVTDTGSGISETDLPYIFDRFYRADKSRTRASGGSGLGLAIVKYIVEAHGGRVWAESPVWNTGQTRPYGTRIAFTLPTFTSHF